jgi:alkyl hydroperoxide reductase subunit AhpF
LIDMSILTSQELEIARSTLEALQNPIVIKVNLTKDALAKKFRNFIEALATVNNKLQPIFTTYAEDDPSTIEIKPNLRYMALPGGREMAPFLQTLISRSQGETSLAEGTLSRLTTFTLHFWPTSPRNIPSRPCPLWSLMKRSSWWEILAKIS